MSQFKSNDIKKQNLPTRGSKRVRIFSTRIFLISVAIAYILLNSIINEALAQTPYLSSNTAPVPIGKNATASAFCNDGDGMISGGYSIGFLEGQSAFDTMLYSNHPIQEINQTGYFEGWEAGLVNKGNATAQITAIVLCLNLTLTA